MRFKYLDKLTKSIQDTENIGNIMEIQKEVNQCINALTKLTDEIKKSELPEHQIGNLLNMLEGKVKKYGLVWENQNENKLIELRNKYPNLKELKDKEIINDLSKPVNILIEGDNIQSLYTLTYTHKGKVNLIVIDPPYNTRNKDFIYNDNFVGEDDEYRHSKWLSFMEPRLKLARELLSDTGIIFINIDEHELYQLKILCDEVFGEDNFCGQFNWYKSATPPNLSNKIKRNIEYILCYEKNKNNYKYTGIQKYSPSDDPIVKPQNKFKVLEFKPYVLNIKLADGVISKGIYGTKKYPNELMDDLIIKNNTNENTIKFKNRFIWNQDKLNYEISNGTTINLSRNLVISFKKKNYNKEVPPNLINNDVGVSTNEEAGKLLKEIFNGKNVFDYPKPVNLIKYLIKFRDNKNAIILDFFAGSGTTGQAVLELNKDDFGKRQFILCTNNEISEKKQKQLKKKGIDKCSEEWEKEGICKKVTYPRLEKVINGYVNTKGGLIEGLGGNLKYYEINMVDKIGNFDKDSENLVTKLNPIICIKENTFKEYEKNNGDNYFIFTDYKENKIVAIYTTYPRQIDITKDLINKLHYSKIKEKILYLPLRDKIGISLIKRDYDIRDIKIEFIPKELIDIHQKLNISLKNISKLSNEV